MSELGIGRLVQSVRKSAIKWRYYDNLGPSLSYGVTSKGQFGIEGRRVLDSLNRDGIAITSAQALLGEQSVYDELKNDVARYEQELADELAAARSRITQKDIEKAFKFSYVVGRRKLHSDDALVRFAIQEPIVRIVNAYFGMYTHLRFINVWRTFASQEPARDSQLWHHDRDDRYIVKVFVYLSDVDETAGPFTYAPGTHLKGNMRREPRGRVERAGGPLRSTDEEMAEVVPRDRWITATGPAGTIVFADTRGLHCGGRARGRDRLMAINMFASSASARRPDRVIEHSGMSARALSREQEFALFE
jgi:hypothetical protein